MTTPAYQRKRAGMISGLLQTSEYAREFLHLACGPLNHGEDEIDRMVAKLGYRSASMSAVLSSRCALDPTAITRAGALAASWVRMRAAALFCSAPMRSSPFAEVAGSV